jgi:hypothetical protein
MFNPSQFTLNGKPINKLPYMTPEQRKERIRFFSQKINDKYYEALKRLED